MKTILVLVVMMTMLTTTSCKKQTNWFDYGNGKVNLEKVTFLSSNMYIAVVNQRADGTTIGEEMVIVDGPITHATHMAAIAKLKATPETWNGIRTKAFIKLDMFTIRLQDLEGYGITLTGNNDLVSLMNNWRNEYEDISSQTN